MADYVTLAELKAWLRIDDDDDVDNAELSRAITDASHQIDHLCSQTFPVVDEDTETTIYAQPWWNRDANAWVIDVPVIDVDTYGAPAVFLWVEEDFDWTAAVDLAAAPGRPYRPYGGPLYTQIVLPADANFAGNGTNDAPVNTVKIVGYFGLPAVPAGVRQACILQATRIFKRRESAFGMINTLDGSEQTRLTRAMDPDVIAALRGYIKYWAVR